MNEKFFDLKKEKQDRMLAAILKIFALYGYEAAGTDEMVREAAISKGLLFHYFDSKLGAYAFAYSYAVRFLELELSGSISLTEKDPFRLAGQAEKAVAAVMHSYPYVQLFLYRAREEQSEEALRASADSREKIAAIQKKLLQAADFGPYAVVGQMGSAATREKILRMLDFTVKGVLEDELRKDDFTPERFLEQVCSYIDLVAMTVR